MDLQIRRNENFLGDAFNVLAFCDVLADFPVVEVSHGNEIRMARVVKRTETHAVLDIDGLPFAFFPPLRPTETSDR